MTLKTPLLDQVKNPDDLKSVDPRDLKTLADELRAEMIDAVSGIGGHFGAGLGVVELTVALHYVFNTPDDRLIWDVSHQCYPHKILTERRDRIRTIRQKGGLYGFTKRSESAYDPFGAAHSSTSVSAGFGMAVGRDLIGKDNKIISVLGDGSASSGMIYEAMLNAGASDSQLLVILNDNGMSIAPALGGLTNYLKCLVDSRGVQSGGALSEQLKSVIAEGRERVTKLSATSTFFEQFGFQYVGPVDGHDIDQLREVLETIRDDAKGPILLHAITEKGRGHPFGDTHKENYHAVGKFCPAKGEMAPKAPAPAPTYTKVFADSLIEQADKDDKVVAITAAMPSGTGLDIFEKAHPERMFDVGIAEQHAVTFAAGLACEGLKPFCTIYSTFLQRGYDQLVHDVALQNLPVRFAMDRAGLVGNDGATHAGSFDLAYLSCLPNMMIMAAADEADLVHMVATATAYDAGPSALRYPRGAGQGVDLPKSGEVLPIGKGRIMRQGSKIAILSLGGRLYEALEAAEKLQAHGLSTTVADARFAKPLDTELIEQLAREHEVLITIEEGASGGFGAHVLTHLARAGCLDKGLKIRPMTIPDRFIDHGSPKDQYVDAGLMAADIFATALSALEDNAAKTLMSAVSSV